MDNYITRSSSNPNLSKREREDNSCDQWNIPKRFAALKPQNNVTHTATSNRFSSLQSEQDVSKMPEPLRAAIMPRKKTGNIPPIIIQLQSDWTHGKIKDNVTKFDKNFHLQYRGNNKVAVQCYSAESHRLIKNGLLQEKVTFHTFSRKDEKTYKAVIRGLPEYFEETLVQELAAIGFEGTKITKLKSTKNKEAQCPPFLVHLPSGSDITKFRQVKYLGNCAVNISRFKPNTSAGTQCFRCQGFGHSSHNCNLTPRCVKCTTSHATKDCPKKDKTDPARCCNCDQEHPANYRQCPTRQKYVERMNSRRPQGNKQQLLVPEVPHVRTEGRPWSSTVNCALQAWPPLPQTRIPRDIPDATRMRTNSPQPSEANHGLHVQDEATKDMLQILNIIKTLKVKFLTCDSMVEKVILVLTHLSSYI